MKATGIEWIGDSDYWNPQSVPGDCPVIMPLVEESVLDAALLAQVRSRRGLSIQAAINCTSRLALRVALEPTGLNPTWQALPWQPGVIKAPASCLNMGVRYFSNTEYVDRLRNVAPTLANHGVWEQWVGGIEFELDGWVVNHQVRFFHALRQYWSRDRTRIERYERTAPPQSIYATVAAATRAVGLNDSPFCAELRYLPDDDRWIVIELNARLGEDDGLASLLSDFDVIAQIESSVL